MRALLMAFVLLLSSVAHAQDGEGFLDRILRPAEGENTDPLPDAPPMVVALDPGHGGEDVGAKGMGQTLEKNVTLRLALLIKDELEKGKAFRVVLTRSDDRAMTPVERLELANGSGALLLVSLHAAGGERPVTRPLHLFVNDPQTPSDERAAGEWRYMANRFDGANRRLAADLSQSLKNFYGAEREIAILPSSRLFLGGANLPTVMVEGLDLAGPTGATLSDDAEGLTKLALSLVDALRTAVRREASRVR